MAFTLLYYAYAVFGLYVVFLSLYNIRTMKRRTVYTPEESDVKVSVLIPARNEEHTIAACLDSLLNQTYSNYEILVIDDHSTDRTWEVVSEYAHKHKKITAYTSKTLPIDWNGKTHALHQLEQYAQGDLYLFTDADTEHSPESLAFGVTNLKKNSLDMFSGFPMQKTPGILIQLIISIMHFSTTFLFPISLHYHTRNPIFSLAIGQYIFITRKAYRDSGGHEQIKAAVTDDVHLAREIVKHGYTQGFLDIRHVVSCTMYSNPRDAFQGITRSIIAFFDKNIAVLLLSVTLFALFVLYPSLLFFWLLIQQTLNIPIVIGYLSIAFAWGAVSTYYRYSPVTAVSAPAALLLPAVMILHGVTCLITKRELLWKDRPVL